MLYRSIQANAIFTERNSARLKYHKCDESLIDLNDFLSRKIRKNAKMPFLVKTKPKIDIFVYSKNVKPHNTHKRVTYHCDLDVGSIIVYWDTLTHGCKG